MASLPQAGATRVSHVPDAAFPASHALRGPRQLLGDLTTAIPLCGLLVRYNHRHLHDCLYGAVSRFGECQALRGVPCTVAVTPVAALGDLMRVDHP